MGNQSLDHNEILCIRWAHDDPNPVAQDSINRADRDALYGLMKAKGLSLENAGFEYPAEYSLPSSKKLKLENGIEVTAQYPELAYPDTDNQYLSASTNEGIESQVTSGVTTMTAEEYAKYCEDYYIAYMAANGLQHSEPLRESELVVESSDTTFVSSAPLLPEDNQQIPDTAADEAAAWIKCTDDETGAVYYFNEQTQVSSWGVPRGVITNDH